MWHNNCLYNPSFFVRRVLVRPFVSQLCYNFDVTDCEWWRKSDLSFCNGSYNTYFTLGWISCLWGSHQCEEVFCKYVHNFWNFSRNFWLFEFIFGFHACEVCINVCFFFFYYSSLYTQFFFIHHFSLNFCHSLHLLGNHHFDHGFVSKKKNLKSQKLRLDFQKLCVFTKMSL